MAAGGTGLRYIINYGVTEPLILTACARYRRM